MKRVAIIAPTYDEAHALQEDRRRYGADGHPSFITPTTHPGAIAGIRFDEIVRIDDARGSDLVEALIASARERSKA